MTTPTVIPPARTRALHPAHRTRINRMSAERGVVGNYVLGDLRSGEEVPLPLQTMQLADIPFSLTDWDDVIPTEHVGETGVATWRTRTFGAIRVRMVQYSPNYRADHWCEKGHILLCLAGELTTELADGRVYHLTSGVSYQVADGVDAHRSSTATGATLFIVD